MAMAHVEPKTRSEEESHLPGFFEIPARPIIAVSRKVVITMLPCGGQHPSIPHGPG
jgi:hypothetical protein